MFSSPPIDYQPNGRFNLPLTYAGIYYNRPQLTMNRNLNAILIGDTVFDWADWCFIDPQWDQLVFPTGFSEPVGDEIFPPLNNYLDGLTSLHHIIEESDFSSAWHSMPKMSLEIGTPIR